MKIYKGKRNWELRIVPADYWERHDGEWCADDCDEIEFIEFDKMNDAFKFIGARLKMFERGIYCGVLNGKEFTLVRNWK